MNLLLRFIQLRTALKKYENSNKTSIFIVISNQKYFIFFHRT